MVYLDLAMVCIESTSLSVRLGVLYATPFVIGCLVKLKSKIK